jgi:hypothetical protein
MMVAQNCRLVMGPGRNGEVYGIVALVPDGKQLIQMRKALGTDLYRTNE